MHYYQFNIGDYASHTKSLSPIEDIAYRRLMDEYYLHEQPLNGCSTDVARSIGMRDYSDDVAYVLDRFFQKDGDIWRHKRIDREIEQYQKQLDAKSKAGKASAKARQARASEQPSNKRSTDDEQVLNSVEQTNNQEPVTINHKPVTKGTQKNKFSDEDLECARWLSEKLREYIPDCKEPNLKGWADHVRKMREIDNRDLKEICLVWLWCRKDDFEAANVQSPEKLRKRYDQLKTKMRQSHGTHQPNYKESLAERSYREAEEIHADIAAREAGERSMGSDETVIRAQVGQSGWPGETG